MEHLGFLLEYNLIKEMNKEIRTISPNLKKGDRGTYGGGKQEKEEK